MAIARKIDADIDDEDVELPTVVELTSDEGQVMFDDEARARLGISGDEFIRRWEAGEFPDCEYPGWNHSDIVSLVLMIPFAR